LLYNFILRQWQEKFKREVVVMRGIYGGKQTPFSPSQELAKAKKVVEGIFNNKNRELIRYIKDIAELRIRGKNSFVAGIKKISDLAMEKVRVSEDKDKRRMINLYFNNLDSGEIERFIERFRKSLKEVENAT
jgi:hypothetical protein